MFEKVNTDFALSRRPVSSANNFVKRSEQFEMSLIYKTKNSGPRQLPWTIPVLWEALQTDLNNGMTRASLRADGKMPIIKEALKKYTMIGEIMSAMILRNGSSEVY
ncbi:uncharacterized protein LOC144425112 [Styela clava]